MVSGNESVLYSSFPNFFRLFNQTMLFCCLVSAIVHYELPKHMKFTEEQVGSKQIVQPGSLEQHSINFGATLGNKPQGEEAVHSSRLSDSSNGVIY